MSSLQDIIDNRQLYESYPVQMLDNLPPVKNEGEFKNVLYMVNQYIQRLDVSVLDNGDITEKDLTDVKFYINEMLHELSNKKDE
jgi:hypothetical protein